MSCTKPEHVAPNGAKLKGVFIGYKHFAPTEQYPSALGLQLLQHLPGPFGFFSEQHDVVLAHVDIETQTRLDVAFRRSKMGTGDVIDVNHESASLGVGDLDELHVVLPQRRLAG